MTDVQGPGLLRAAGIIAARDLRSRLRDRSVLVVAFVAPLALSTILSLALSGGGDGFATSYGLAVADDGPLGEGFTALVTGPALGDFAEVTVLDDAAAAEQAVVDGDVAAAWVVPDGFSAAVMAGDPATVEVISDPSAETSSAIATSIAEGFVARANAAGIAAALAGGGPPVQVEPAITLTRADPEEVRDVAGSYFGPSMALFFTFFVVGFGPRSLVRERDQGTLARILAAPVPPAAVLVGKSIAVMVISLACIGVMWLGTSVLLGASWGAPVGVVALSVAFVLAVAAITGFVATLADTERQVDGLTSMVVFSLALLGGNFIQVDRLPGVLADIATATPNGQALLGFVDLIAGEPVASVLPNVGLMLAVAVVFGALALPRLRRAVSG